MTSEAGVAIQIILYATIDRLVLFLAGVGVGLVLAMRIKVYRARPLDVRT